MDCDVSYDGRPFYQGDTLSGVEWKTPSYCLGKHYVEESLGAGESQRQAGLCLPVGNGIQRSAVDVTDTGCEEQGETPRNGCN